MKHKISKLARGLSPLLFIGSTLFYYDHSRSLLDYMDYLPVYRVERLWEKDSESTFWFGQEHAVKTQQ
ncbi:MAG: hypothetical protein AAFZ92_10025 [Pseudomonadota bacterium]